MAKSINPNKTTFGKRKGGKARKTSGPEDAPTKIYRGQGKKH